MAHPGVLHNYTKKLVAFEHTQHPSSTTPPSTNTLLFLGGLSDGLSTVRYPQSIASSLPSTWSLAEVLLSSSYTGWGTGSLARDARELAQCVAYFRDLRPQGKIVVMGHSTGCQDIMAYLTSRPKDDSNDKQEIDRPKIDGAILQGGVSDREAFADLMSSDPDSLTTILQLAESMIRSDQASEIVPTKDNFVVQEFGAPVTAYRLHSLLAKGGDDDFFSSDLGDAVLKETFGRIGKGVRVCFLMGSRDEYVPEGVDKAALMQRWGRFVEEGGASVDAANGGVVEGGSHNFNGDPEDVVGDLVRRVVGFLERV